MQGLVDAQYTPLADRQLRLKVRKPLPHRALSGGNNSKADGLGGGEGPFTEDGAEPETWHWVPQQAVAVTMRAIAQVREGAGALCLLSYGI